MTYSTYMGAMGDISFNWDNAGPTSAVLLMGLLCYIGGRMHQFYRTTFERDTAYREGYNTATKALFSLAARTAQGVQAPPLMEERKVLPSPKPIRASAPTPPRTGRHHASNGPSTMQQTRVLTGWEKHRR